jgi:hypothetical protein
MRTMRKLVHLLASIQLGLPITYVAFATYFPIFAQSITIVPNPSNGVMVDIKNKPPQIMPPTTGTSYALTIPKVWGLPSSPQDGMVVFYTGKLHYYNGVAWVELDKSWIANGNNIYNPNSGNVGIGVSMGNATRAKFAVTSDNADGTTNGIFGQGNAGISLQQNYPTIGFNQYRDFSGSNTSKYMANGFAYVHYMAPSNGNLYWNSIASGTANTAISPEVNRMVLTNSGKLGIGTSEPTATLDVNGSLSLSIRKVELPSGGSSSFEVLPTDHTVVFTVPSIWSFTVVNLPPASANKGRRLHFVFENPPVRGEDSYKYISFSGIDFGALYKERTGYYANYLKITRTAVMFQSDGSQWIKVMDNYYEYKP